MVGKLGLVMVVVSDMERSVRFYRDIVGLKLLFHAPNWSQFDAGSMLIGLHPQGEQVKVSPTTGMSLGIYVDDVTRTVSELKSKNARIAIEPRDEPFGRWALLQDPDGYNIQLVELASGYRETHKLD